MKLRRIYILLVVWWVFMIGPGMLVELGLFGQVGLTTVVPGIVIFLWLVGYLGQLGVFMWTANIVGDQKVLWWLLVSLMPWAIDWTLPVLPWLVLVWVPITIALAAWIALAAQSNESFQERGIHAVGVVLEVLNPRMNVVVNDVYIKRKVRLRVERDDGVPAYEATLKGLFMLGDIPSAGDRIAILVDPANPQRIEYDKGTIPEQFSPPDFLAPRHPAGRSATGGESIADELEKLARLRDRGDLTDSEFDAAKNRLLRG